MILERLRRHHADGVPRTVFDAELATDTDVIIDVNAPILGTVAKFFDTGGHWADGDADLATGAGGKVDQGLSFRSGSAFDKRGAARGVHLSRHTRIVYRNEAAGVIEVKEEANDRGPIPACAGMAAIKRGAFLLQGFFAQDASGGAVRGRPLKAGLLENFSQNVNFAGSAKGQGNAI